MFNEQCRRPNAGRRRSGWPTPASSSPAATAARLSEEDACRRLFDFAREMGIETIDGEPPPEAFDMLEKLCDEYQTQRGRPQSRQAVALLEARNAA